MFIIMTTVCVAFVGSLLRLSIIKRSDKPQEGSTGSTRSSSSSRASPRQFYNFLMLASRVIRIIFYYCDDFVSTECNVTAMLAGASSSTRSWPRRASRAAPFDLPQHDDPDDKPSSGSGGSDTGSVGARQARRPCERGVPTDQELAAASRRCSAECRRAPFSHQAARLQPLTVARAVPRPRWRRHLIENAAGP